jgi:GH15 family glucan-1,4-alpha-glucosidase
MDSGYPPIEDHAVVGNLRTVALVGRDGAISWCCLPGLDSPSVFASLLDRRRGGRFGLRAAGSGSGDQRYLEDTNVLETVFDTARGRLSVIDFMPLSGSIEGCCGGSPTEPAIYRLLRAEGGPVEVELEWSPRFDYARGRTQAMRTAEGFLAWSAEESMTLNGAPHEAEIHDDGVGPVITCRFELQDGEERVVVGRWGTEQRQVELTEARSLLEETCDTWRSWVHKAEATGSREWAAPHSALVMRSELTLKLLTNADTGAIAAAATTSLPEEIGGVRNWDYRYSWIRDAALVAQALFALGHEAEAAAFINWSERVARGHGDRRWGLQIVYGLHGEEEMPEHDLPNLEGYRRSSPVRVGNGAVDQLQLDIYGELLGAAYEFVRNGGELEPDIRSFLPHVADQACRSWQEQDYGIWELRNGPMHFVYSKVMVWVALDRALRLAELGLIDGAVDLWRQHRRDVREEILQRGFDRELGSFRQSYERAALDASHLLLPILEFLPVDDPRIVATLDATLEGLSEHGLLHRYVADDGVAGREGSFALCNFWAVDALALSGRVEEAREIFERMADAANHVGLYAEEIDPSSGAFLGNFPQAFTHLGLINSAVYLAMAEGRDVPVAPPIGSAEHFAERVDGDERVDGEGHP